MAYSKQWRSEFAKRLKTNQNTDSVEDAVIKLVEDKLKFFGDTSPPTNLKKLASLCGINPNFEFVEMDADGWLVPDEKSLHIQVNASHNKGRQRFTIAHEITHKILEQGVKLKLRKCSNVGRFIERDEEEWLCDFGAKQILRLTYKYLHPITEGMGISFHTVEQIRSEFDISHEAAVRSLVETSTSPAAALYLVPSYRKSEETQARTKPLWPDFEQPKPKLRINRAYASRNFPIHFYAKNVSIHEDSCIYKAPHSDYPIIGRETRCFNKKDHLQVDIEAISREIYVRGKRHPGVVVLLTNPIEQP